MPSLYFGVIVLAVSVACLAFWLTPREIPDWTLRKPRALTPDDIADLVLYDLSRSDTHESAVAEGIIRANRIAGGHVRLWTEARFRICTDDDEVRDTIVQWVQDRRRPVSRRRLVHNEDHKPKDEKS